MGACMSDEPEEAVEGDEDDLVEGRSVELPLIELSVCMVEADPAFNCRPPYSASEIEAAYAHFERTPMLHAPTVAPHRGLSDRYRLVAGFKRFAVLELLAERRGLETAVFGLVEGRSEEDLLLLNVTENVARGAVPGAYLAERFTALVDVGLTAKEIAARSGVTVRHVRRLLAIRREAHPELWSLYEQGHETLSMRRMLELVGHERDQQLDAFRQSEELHRQARDVERGFSERLDADAAPEAEGPGAEPPAPRSRRRYPPRRHARRLLYSIKRDDQLDPQYRAGFVAAMRHMLDGDDVPVRWNAVVGPTTTSGK